MNLHNNFRKGFLNHHITTEFSRVLDEELLFTGDKINLNKKAPK